MSGHQAMVASERGASAPGAPASTDDTVRARSGIRHDLQGVRALAVLGVVVFHLKAKWLPGGFAGVDVFFVLSGFFITGQLLREIDRTGRVSLPVFWGRRARRLLPASLLVLVATLVAARVLTNPLETARVARDGLYTTVFGMNWHEAAGGVSYGKDPDPSPLQHYWSLGVEEQFYLAWPLLLAALAMLWRRRSTLSARRTLVAFAVPACVLSFLLAFVQTSGNQPYAYYGTVGRVWQLAVGGVLAAATVRTAGWPAWVGRVARPAGFVAVAGFYLLAPSVSEYPGWWSVVPTLGAAMLVLSGEPRGRREPSAWLLTSRLGQLGGRYSYSWYLWHWAPLVLVPIALERKLRVRELGLCALGTLVLAVLTYHLLEDPVRRNAWLARPRRGRSLLLGVALLAIGLVASQFSLTSAENRARNTRIVGSAGVLTPQPAEAAAQQVPAFLDGCQLGITSQALAPECRYRKDTGKGDVVLVGDSHASMWSGAADRIARANGWGLRIWARSSCPFADVQKTVIPGSPYTACTRWRADVVRRLIADRPSLVVVANYVQNTLHVDDPRSGKPAHAQRAHTLFRAGMARTLRTLRKAGLRVLVVGDVPGHPRPAPDCALVHAGDLSRCAAPQRKAVPFGGVDVQAAKAVPGVRFVDLTDVFCRDKICYQVVGNVLAYRDENHLTNEMAMKLAPTLADAIRDALD
jgi:peptidoglycan/LPS O-acetylase OafA/YrhL